MPRNPRGVSTRVLPTADRRFLNFVFFLFSTLKGCKCKSRSVGNQTDADLPVFTAGMNTLFAEENGAGPLTVLSSSEPLSPSQETVSLSSETVGTSSESGFEPHAMEVASSKVTLAKDDKAAASAATEGNNVQAMNENVAGADPTKKRDEFHHITSDLQATPAKELKHLATDEEMKTVKRQNTQASPMEGNLAVAAKIKVDKNRQNEHVSPNEREVEAEFLRLSLGFKCDWFTLEKRVQLEERSRDLAEENLKKEVINAQMLLQALSSVCEEDNQAQDIVKKMQKSLEFFSQYASRVASRAEMLGAINQESRVSKAVEVMIQHVENLKRMYTKEHAELEELKQVLLQNERSFSSLGERDESSNKKLPSALNFKGQLHEPDGDEKNDRFNRRSSSWGMLGSKQGEKRPSLQRFISAHSWTEAKEQSKEKNNRSEAPVEEEKSRKSSVEKERNPSKWSLGSAFKSASSWTSSLKTTFCNANKTLCISVIAVVFLAALASFFAGLSLQRPVEAAPVGTGDAWTSLQKLLWPYTGLRHNRPPPV
uniref:Inositol 1,4,5-triphosphate receptor associated 2 n=1 Tax=Sphenodon punctatus TaxID=8508 RepID=A0A8D0HQU3_SPHPU